MVFAVHPDLTRCDAAARGGAASPSHQSPPPFHRPEARCIFHHGRPKFLNGAASQAAVTAEPGVRLRPEGPLSFQKKKKHTALLIGPCCKGCTGFLCNRRELIFKLSVRGGRTDAGITPRRERIGVVWIHRCTRQDEECSSCHWTGSPSGSALGLVAVPSLNSPPFPGNAGYIVFRSHSTHPQMSWNWQRQLFTS